MLLRDRWKRRETGVVKRDEKEHEQFDKSKRKKNPKGLHLNLGV